MNFSEALQELIKGKEIKRSGWNDTTLSFRHGIAKHDDTVESISGVPIELFDNTDVEGLDIEFPKIMISYKDDSDSPYEFLPEQADLFATEWEIVSA